MYKNEFATKEDNVSHEENKTTAYYAMVLGLDKNILCNSGL